MAKYNNIVTADTHTLTPLASGFGSISSIHISNNDSNSTDIDVFLDTGTNQYYFVKGLNVPANTSLVLDDSIPFDSNTYSLKITNTGLTPNLTVIIT